MSELDDLKKELVAANERLANVETALRARSDAERWAADNPEFYQCRANANAMADEIHQRGLPFTYESYAAVYADIKEKLEKEPAEQPTIDTEAPEKQKLTASDRQFLEEAERMSANEFQKKLRDRDFVRRYNRLVPPVKVGS